MNYSETRMYVYILQSKKNGRYYIGSSENVEKRLQEHNDGKTKATRYIRPLILVFQQKFDTPTEARSIEYKLKQYKSRTILEKIIQDGIIRFANTRL